MRATLLTIGGTTLLLLALVLLAISRYDWNVSALLRVDRQFGEHFNVPDGIILFEDGGYDGMLYYQIARDIPSFFRGEATYDSSYRWQRILLPFAAFILSHGNKDVLPFTFLLINLTAVLGAFALLFALAEQPKIHIWTIVGNPAALVGILFTLTEPLALFTTTLFLFLWKKAGERITLPAAAALAFAMLARETALILIVPLCFILSSLNRKLEGFKLASVSLMPYLLWMAFLMFFAPFPSKTGGGVFSVPLLGVISLMQRLFESANMYLLSSAGFFLLFFAPLCIVVVRQLSSSRDTLTILLASSLSIFLVFDPHIWGVLTSVGRVVPALYPLYVLWAEEHDTFLTRALSTSLIAISTITALGIALTPHSFIVT